MAARVFIDGDAGTTGLQIRARLAGRGDIALVRLPEALRKDVAARRDALNAADLVILCLPDAAAREAVALIENPSVRVIDASTAHRTHPDWAYGFPEISPGSARRIAAATRVANPGCYASGAIALLRPLVRRGLVPPDYAISINAVSGYSGGGRRLIARYEDGAAPDHIASGFRSYALALEHKHVEEMRIHGGLGRRPLFLPAVGRFRQGMIVQVPLHLDLLPGRPKVADIHAALAAHYAGARFVTLAEREETAALEGLDAEALNGTNAMRLHVLGNQCYEHVVLVAVLDNLGKGASGAAVQNMNLMLGRAPEAGLETARAAA